MANSGKPGSSLEKGSKLWQKNNAPLGAGGKEVENFTVGNDREMDIYLAAFDVLGSLAHTQMLETIGLLTKSEKDNCMLH